MTTEEEDIRGIARSLPGAFERESYGGRPSWRTSPRMFAWIRDDPEALVVWVESLEAKEALIAAEPGKFFATSHYDGQPIVLVRLEATEVDEARELVTDVGGARKLNTFGGAVSTQRLECDHFGGLGADQEACCGGSAEGTDRAAVRDLADHGH